MRDLCREANMALMLVMLAGLAALTLSMHSTLAPEVASANLTLSSPRHNSSCVNGVSTDLSVGNKFAENFDVFVLVPARAISHNSGDLLVGQYQSNHTSSDIQFPSSNSTRARRTYEKKGVSLDKILDVWISSHPLGTSSVL